MGKTDKKDLEQAADVILGSNRTTAFTGAGISVESGVPPFRGEGGLWHKYDPEVLDIGFFHAHPGEAWRVIKEIFYDFFDKVKPNGAHFALAELEKMRLLHSIITQNIDNLHHDAGSAEVYEFHGSSRDLVCTGCGELSPSAAVDLMELPPFCRRCGSLLKPDFIFFGEPIPEEASRKSWAEAVNAEVFILVGTSGEVMPAAMIPFEAKKRGKTIIEINVEASKYTGSITDIFLEGKAASILEQMVALIKQCGDSGD